MKKLNYFLRSLFAIILLAVGVNTAVAETVTMTTFTATNASMDDYISYTTAKGGGTSAPAIYSGEIRLYQNGGGTGGGTITIKADEGATLNSVTIGSSMKTSVAYTIGTSSTKSSSASLAANGKYTVNDINSNSITFYCMGSDKNSRLYVNHLSVVYTKAGGGSEPDEPEEPALPTPTLTADATTLTFDGYTNETLSDQTVEVSVQNIDPEVISGVISGDNQDMFEVTNNGLVYTVSCTATEVGVYTATLTFSAEGVDVAPVEVALSANIKERPATVRYQLVTDASTLRVGDQVIIVAADENAALSTNQKSSNREAVGIEKSDNYNYIDITDEAVQVLTLQAGTVDGTFAFNTGEGYLYAASSSGNQLKTKAELDVNGSWTIVITEGVASIVATSSSNRNVMQYNPNNGSPLFACYASASQKAVALYRIPHAEGVTSEQCYFLNLNDEWTEAAGKYYAKFINLNTGDYTWVMGEESNGVVIFYLSQYNVRSGEMMPTYTHVVFFKSEGEYDLAVASKKTAELMMTAENCYYDLTTESVTSLPTGIEGVVAADGIRYAYGVVEAEGAIEVYNVNGTVVARGNDNVDLAGLGRGVYIIRNGNQVRKVVR